MLAITTFHFLSALAHLPNLSTPRKEKLQIRLASYAGNVEYVQAGVGKMDGSAPIGILVSVMNELSSSLTA